LVYVPKDIKSLSTPLTDNRTTIRPSYKK